MKHARPRISAFLDAPSRAACTCRRDHDHWSCPLHRAADYPADAARHSIERRAA